MSNSSSPVPAVDSPDLSFPPLYKSQVLHCSYHWWYKKYRSLTPKARVIPLNDAFVDYLRADGIVLPPEQRRITTDDDSGIFSDDSYDDEDDVDVSEPWADIHEQVCSTIDELGGKVTPKLNWSAPQDATFMSITNDMMCTNANEVYLLLKSSEFISHDLEHAWDDTVPDPEEETEDKGKDKEQDDTAEKVPTVLVLRKHFNMNPSVEFRVFVQNKRIVCLCQRDPNHYDFLFPMRDELRLRIEKFFDMHLKDTFPDPNFVFDVYIPAPHDRVWLIDINPWAERTDTILFSWSEIFDKANAISNTLENGEASDSGSESDTEDVEEVYIPEFRLIKKDDPEAFNFTTPKYSAHKMPKDVVDASRSGPGGLSEFLTNWKEILDKNIKEDEEYESSSGDETAAAAPV